ncbi:hypothetical protein DXG03_009126 [Asterophora parasitica]|uniref:EthD domain-containing protein n=1 Tax=Asterophora parasitica TaxID=117018 RepID=A0A9P7GBC7_9AGAR|nr:hypothetical protein DXG03_009126 [Asterophora parasitica]
MSIEARTDRVRVIFFVKQNSKRPRVGNSEELGRSWISGHAEPFISLDIFKKNILKYELVLIDNKLVTAPQALGLTALDQWDGMVILEGESYDKLFEVLDSDEYKRLVWPLEQEFIIRSEGQVLPLDLYTRA